LVLQTWSTTKHTQNIVILQTSSVIFTYIYIYTYTLTPTHTHCCINTQRKLISHSQNSRPGFVQNSSVRGVLDTSAILFLIFDPIKMTKNTWTKHIFVALEKYNCHKKLCDHLTSANFLVFNELVFSFLLSLSYLFLKINVFKSFEKKTCLCMTLCFPEFLEFYSLLNLCFLWFIRFFWFLDQFFFVYWNVCFENFAVFIEPKSVPQSRLCFIFGEHVFAQLIFCCFFFIILHCIVIGWNYYIENHLV
jgi:hypothetical protein